MFLFYTFVKTEEIKCSSYTLLMKYLQAQSFVRFHSLNSPTLAFGTFFEMATFPSGISVTDETSFPYIFQLNATVPLPELGGLVRCNVYRPKTSGKVPAIITYGPYGKDLPYKVSVATYHSTRDAE
jgi:hypothetical protein